MNKHILVVGLGSGGSAVADMLARQGVGKLTLIDPDKITSDNIKRHVLTNSHVLCDDYKVVAMKRHIQSVSDCKVAVVKEKFDASLFERFAKPDAIASCADSDLCSQLVNAYSLRENIPAVYGAVWGAAETARIITVVPGETPCYACYEHEGPDPEPSQEKYTNPNYDPTKAPHQEGLWCDVLTAASLQVQGILGVLGEREKLPPLSLMSLRYPFKTEFYAQEERCAVCSDNMEGLCRNF